MPVRLAHAPIAEIRVRRAERADLDALMDLEHRVFATDRLSRRSLRQFLKSPSAEVMVAEDNRLVGTAIVGFPDRLRRKPSHCGGVLLARVGSADVRK